MQDGSWGSCRVPYVEVEMPVPEIVSVLLAEDHAVVREGTREMLTREPGIRVVGEVRDGLSAVSQATALRPDVLLLDLGLPELNGIEVTRRVRELPDPPAVLVLSAYDDMDYVRAALEAGAGGYLLKTAHTRDVVAAIGAVARGEIVLDPGIARQLLGAPTATREPVLSGREIEVLRAAARGLRTREIATELGTSTRTVESHLTGIFNKLGVGNRTEAVMVAAARGWLAVEEGRLRG